MKKYLGQISIVVRDYDEALSFYISVLGFQLIEDTVLSPHKRWVVIAPPHNEGKGCHLLLAKAANESQLAAVGNQSGGRVFLFLYTDDLQRDYESLRANGVTIIKPPSQEAFGKALVFSDLYGNLWDLIEPVLPA